MGSEDDGPHDDDVPTDDYEETHEFEAENYLLLVVIMSICIMVGYLMKKYKLYYLPDSAAVILVGLLIGFIAKMFTDEKELDFLSFSPELFYFLLLPPIIFEAGYSMRRKQFFQNFAIIVMYAVFGTLVSTFLIGFATYMLGVWDMAPVDKKDPMEALLFGALISAVDPVATLSIMGSPELNCDPLLYSLVFGESVLNDAVAIVLFHTFRKFYETRQQFGGVTIPIAVGSFIVISLGSVLIGCIIGLVCSYLFKNTAVHNYPQHEISLLFLFAYLAYAFAEAISLSGIMALFFCGIVMAHYNSYNLSDTTREAADNIAKTLAQMSEYLVFLYMGMGFFTGRFHEWNFKFIALAISFCLIARLFNTFPFSALANMRRAPGKKIDLKMQVVIWFAGLRGAIAFALSQNMPGPNKDLYATTTLCVVIFTTVICGGLTAPLLELTDMKVKEGVERDDSSESESDEEGELTPLTKSVYGYAQPHDEHGNYEGPIQYVRRRYDKSELFNSPGGFHGIWKQVDIRMKPIFGGSVASAGIASAQPGTAHGPPGRGSTAAPIVATVPPVPALPVSAIDRRSGSMGSTDERFGGSGGHAGDGGSLHGGDGGGRVDYIPQHRHAHAYQNYSGGGGEGEQGTIR